MIVVFGDGGVSDPAPFLAQGLGLIGETVVVAVAPDSGDEVADALARAEDDAGEPLHAVVLASAGRAPTEEGELAGLDPLQWNERVETPLRRTLAAFQGTYRRLSGAGGRFVVMVPTASLVGAAGYAPWAALAEAQRSLAKSAARSWGHEGITVNCVAVPGALLSPTAPPGPDRPGLLPPSLDRPPALVTDVAPVVASIVGGAWGAVTGATIAVDAGSWMTP